MQPKRVGILGQGRYGTFLKTFFSKRGCEVRTSDIGTNPSNEEVTAWAEVIIVAVTLLETVKVIESIAPSLREDQLLVDIASTKAGSVDAMLKSPAEVLGLHPFCAPPVKRGTFKGQTMFVCRARVAGWGAWVDEFLASTEATIEIVQPERHDLERTVDQVLEHMCTCLKVSVMRKLGLNATKLFDVASPVYKLTSAQMARMFSQSPDLYGGLALSNPFASKTLAIFGEEFKRYSDFVKQGTLKPYVSDFLANSVHLGPTNVRTLFLLSEQLTSLMADLQEANSMYITIPEDRPGILEEIATMFRTASINLTVIHSRKLEGKTEFFIGFDRDREAPEVMTVRRRLKDELRANLI